MRRWIILLLVCPLCPHLSVQAQEKNLARCHYWFDETRKGETTINYSGADTLRLSLNTNELSTGIHRFFIRFQDTEGAWSMLYSHLFFVLERPANTEPKVEQAEYWTDNDYSKRKSITVSDDQVAFTLDASSLHEGLHTLSYRVKDSNGKFTPLQTWAFFRTELRDTTLSNRIESVSYWFDNDISQLKTIQASGDTIQFTADATKLTEGLHTLSYRAKDVLGEYSPLQTWAFYKQGVHASKIAWYKYWWNDHYDKAVHETVANGTETFTFEKELTIPDYAKTDGFSSNSTARFQIVFGDDLGNVSAIESATISYPDQIPPVSIIEANAETTTESVTLNWYVVNDQQGDFNVYYSENDQPFVLWLPNTTSTTATFKGQAGSTYRFTVTARDKTGNREAMDESKCVKVEFY